MGIFRDLLARSLSSHPASVPSLGVATFVVTLGVLVLQGDHWGIPTNYLGKWTESICVVNAMTQSTVKGGDLDGGRSFQGGLIFALG